MNTAVLYIIYFLIILVLALVSIHLFLRLLKPRLSSREVTQGDTTDITP